MPSPNSMAMGSFMAKVARVEPKATASRREGFPDLAFAARKHA